MTRFGSPLNLHPIKHTLMLRGDAQTSRETANPVTVGTVVVAIPSECGGCVSEFLGRIDNPRCNLRTEPMQGRVMEHEQRRDCGTNQGNRGNKVALTVLQNGKCTQFVRLESAIL